MVDPIETIVAERDRLRAENAALRQAGVECAKAGYAAAHEVLQRWSSSGAETQSLVEKMGELANTAIDQRDSARTALGAANDRINQLSRDLAATTEILDCYKRTVAEGGPVSTALAEQVAGLKAGLLRLMPLRSLVGDYEWSQLDRHDLARDEHLADKVIAAYQQVERDEKAYREGIEKKGQTR